MVIFIWTKLTQAAPTTTVTTTTQAQTTTITRTTDILPISTSTSLHTTISRGPFLIADLCLGIGQNVSCPGMLF